MKKIIGLICFATLLLAGCVKELENSQNIAGDFPTFYASFGDASDETTKTYVDDKMKLRWTEDDRLSIFVGNTFNHEYKYDGETGANNGSFSAVTTSEFIAGEKLEANYAVYPYNASHEMDPEDGLSVVLPSVQKYAQNSFGLGANTMVAATENKEDNFLQFKNLCGYVVVKLYGEGTVTSIKLEGNDGEKISGKADVQAAFGTLPSVTMSEEATTSITLDCGDGVTLGTTAETATEFWLCVPPVTFSKGFTVTATKTDGWQMIKSTSSSKEVVRNTKNALTPIEAVFDTPSAEVVPPDDEIWYITKNREPLELMSSDFFDQNIVSDIYSGGKGVIKFSGPINIIKSYAFLNVPNSRNLTELSLPDCIETIEDDAFFTSEEVFLNTFYIPKKLKTISGKAFSGGLRICRFKGDERVYNGQFVVMNGVLTLVATSEDLTLTIPNICEIIGDFAMWGRNQNIKCLIIEEGVKTLGGYAFSGCRNLEEVFLPNTIEDIGYCIFDYCDKIKQFHGPDKYVSADGKTLFRYVPYDGVPRKYIMNVAKAGLCDYSVDLDVFGIDSESFCRAEDLRSITFSNPYIYVSGDTFDECYNLEKISGPGASADGRCFFGKGSFGIDCPTAEPGRLLVFAGKGIYDYSVDDYCKEIGSGVFAYLKDLRSIVIPDEVTRLGHTVFWGCSSLVSVTLPALCKYIGNDIFTECTSLNSIYVRSLTPPSLENYSDGSNVNLGISKNLDNLSIYVPSQSVDLYKTSYPWSLYANYIKGMENDYSDAYVSTDYSADGSVHTVQTATTGNGVNVVLMGDAFSDRQIADGTYNNVMQKAVNALFSEEPYKSYKDYFTVYTVDAVSMTEGYEHGGQVFSTGHGGGTYVYGNDNKVVEYAQKVLTDEQIDDALIIVMMNEDAYAGTCFMYYPNSGDCGRGLSIAYFPTSSDIDTFNGLVSHEAGGHGFAKLADEYAYEENGSAPINYVSEIKSQQSDWGWYKNVDFTSDPTQVKWSKFLSDERYANEGLGCFEGGLTYWSGVWRPTDYSIMRYNTGGFNAPSREAIWYRIHKLAYGEDWQYNYEDFVAYDAINRTPAAQAASRAKVKAAAAARKGKPFQPLHEPVIVKHSWRDAVNNAGNNNSR